MRLIKPSWKIEWLKPREEILKSLELFGRTCYKSEERIQEGSAEKFCRMLLGRNHLSVIEHESMSVRFVCDRGVTHELVRHRLASFSQESTRYCNYGSDHVTFVIPPWVVVEPGLYVTDRSVCDILPTADYRWFLSMRLVEDDYKRLLGLGWTPQQARSVLPNSLKTEIVMTANLREWMHVFAMRCQGSAHPQMRELMVPLYQRMSRELPELFPAKEWEAVS